MDKSPKKKECPPGKVINPVSGRCINKPKSPKKKECPPGKVINPISGRCINKINKQQTETDDRGVEKPNKVVKVVKVKNSTLPNDVYFKILKMANENDITNITKSKLIGKEFAKNAEEYLKKPDEELFISVGEDLYKFITRGIGNKTLTDLENRDKKLMMSFYTRFKKKRTVYGHVTYNYVCEIHNKNLDMKLYLNTDKKIQKIVNTFRREAPLRPMNYDDGGYENNQGLEQALKDFEKKNKKGLSVWNKIYMYDKIKDILGKKPLSILSRELESTNTINNNNTRTKHIRKFSSKKIIDELIKKIKTIDKKKTKIEFITKLINDIPLSIKVVTLF